MSIFDMFKLQTKRQPDVLESLLEAAAKQDFKTLTQLCWKHQEEIRGSFAVWSKVPEVVRKGDPATINRFAEGLIAIAQTFELNGDASLLSHLRGKDSGNPIIQWEADLIEAQSLLDSGKLMEAILMFQAILSKNAELLAGTAIDHYLPRTLGMLGAAYFKIGNKDKAVECMSKARSLCEKSGDTEGVAIYEGNLRHLAAQDSSVMSSEEGR